MPGGPRADHPQVRGEIAYPVARRLRSLGVVWGTAALAPPGPQDGVMTDLTAQLRSESPCILRDPARAWENRQRGVWLVGWVILAVGTIPLVLGSLLVVWADLHAHRWERRLRRRHMCPHCGYNLSDSLGDLCPECGKHAWE